jgi:hypothetical protein
VRLEEAPAPFREDGGVVPTVERHPFDQLLLFEMPQIVSLVERRIPWVAQVPFRYHPKGSNRGESSRVGPAQRVLTIAVMNQLPFAALRQVQVAHEHVAWVEASALDVTIPRVAVALLSPILVTVARFVLH